MRLSRLCQGLTLDDRIGRDVEITSLTCDTRTLTPGGLFAALPGSARNGADFISEALSKGAAAVLCSDPPPTPGPWLGTKEVRRAYAAMAAHWFGDPGKDLTLLGVTGTNGKTTTTYLLKTILEGVLDTPVGLIGTNQNLVGHRALPPQGTTPDPYALQCLLAQMKKEGCTHVVMEVSSHALVQERTGGLTFAGGIFTNLTQDHLDYHHTMEAYQRAKAKLFAQCQVGCFNGNDPAGVRMAAQAPCRVCTYGINTGDLWGEGIRLTPQGGELTLHWRGESQRLRLPLPGRFNLSNALGALACCLSLGLPLKPCLTALEGVKGVKGRMEVVPTPAPYTVIVDYAHTPDALAQVLSALRETTSRHLICLFGCGGNRDRAKRPQMAHVVGTLADFVILTSDNPRWERPEDIMAETWRGFPPETTLFLEPDRRRAISLALTLGRRGDVILLAGKGHETWQEVAGKKLPLDEREEIASFFQKNAV